MFVMLINSVGIIFVNAAVDVDPGNDFNGYMNEMDRLQHEELIYEEKLAAHEEWRQTTWGGWSVRHAQLVMNHFKPFLIMVLDALTNTNQQSSGSIQQFVMYIGVRMFVIGVFILLFYSCQKIVQLVVGNNDIEVIEEIIIVHEHDTEEEASKARSQTTRGKRSKSTNKQKSQ